MIISGLILISCNNSDSESENCLDYKHAFITQVHAETEELTVKKNEDLPIKLNYFIENSCGSFYDFEVLRNEKEYDIRVKAKYEGCNCNEIASYPETIYYFRSPESGFYTLNFFTSNTEFITKIIYVE